MVESPLGEAASVEVRPSTTNDVEYGSELDPKCPLHGAKEHKIHVNQIMVVGLL